MFVTQFFQFFYIKGDPMEDEPRKWCPLCEPDIDPFEDFVQEMRCTAHTPSMEGDKDTLAKKKLGNQIYSQTEGDGETGRAWANFLNREET